MIKDPKVWGSSVVKGTMVKNIRLEDGDYDVECKIPGVGSMMLKSELIRNA